MAAHAASTDVTHRCDLALDLARGAGDILRSGLGRATAENKGAVELGTEFDRASEGLNGHREAGRVSRRWPVGGGGQPTPGGELALAYRPARRHDQLRPRPAAFRCLHRR